MSSSAAELSSLATALDELTRRVTAIADRYLQDLDRLVARLG